MLLLTGICCFAHAGEIYKWTDENGKVHFGDRSAAPSEGKKIDVRVQPPSSPPSEKATHPEFQPPNLPPALFSPPPSPMPSRPDFDPAKKSVPVDAARVGPKCQGLIDQIKVKATAGTPWQSLYKEFNEACPGIAYECVSYRTHPENNKCGWVERSGNTVLQTKNYP